MTLTDFLFLFADHLWQSTVFVFAAALVALAVKTNPARVRYWIWWLASVKFLIPFSLLVSVGGQLSRRVGPAEALEPSMSAVVIEQVAQAFTSNMVWSVASSSSTDAPPGESMAILPAVAVAVWLIGCVLMLFRWERGWRRVRGLTAKSRGASLLNESRELQALRRLEGRAGLRRPLDMVSSEAVVEPCVFGLLRRTLIWPSGLSGRLADEEIEGILLHELAHDRRRDNLTSALHMVVETLFWFHPLVWWIGKHLLAERETACDEDVLRWGCVPHAYAEGILKVCEFCLGSPVPCAAGVTGSDLKKRIEAVIRNRAVLQLSWSRTVLLVLMAITITASPIAFGITQTELPTFEVVSIRVNPGGPGAGGLPIPASYEFLSPPECRGNIQVNPGRFTATAASLYRLVALAYGKNCRLTIEQNLISGGPDWTKSLAFDIQATIPEGTPAYTTQQLLNGEAPILQKMIQNLLADRVKLVLHHNTKEIPVFNLVVVKMDKFRLSEDQSPLPPPPSGPPRPGDPSAPPPRGTFGVGVDPSAGKVRIMAKAAPISTIINFIQGGVGRMVVDKTELKGLIDIPPQTLDVGPYEITPTAQTIWPQIMQQLGLRLVAVRGPAEVLVINRAEKPPEN